MPGDQSLADALGAILGRPVGELRRLTGGASRETWAGDGFVLQRVLPGPSLDAQPADMAGEAQLIRAAADSGVPVAPVLAACGDSDLPPVAEALGDAWMVLSFVDGETIPRRILRNDTYATARAHLLPQAAAALAAIHRIPLTAAPHLQRPDPIERFRGALDFLGQPQPALELGLRWLDANRPPSVDARVVHGDFRLGNWIVGSDGLRAVVDWELSHVGDPAEDLGWMCVRAWRFASPLPAAGLGGRDELLAAYRDAGGDAIDPQRLRWWEALGTLGWAVMCIAQAARHRIGSNPSVELAAIGRRVCENEHDLLALLPGPGRPTSVASDQSVGHDDVPHDVPSAVELLDAVAGYLRDDVLGATSGRVQFHARVAANVVDQVRRQWELGAAQATAHRARLARLGFRDDRALADAIRSGTADDRFEEIKTAAWESTLDKLAVAHPGYVDE